MFYGNADVTYYWPWKHIYIYIMYYICINMCCIGIYYFYNDTIFRGYSIIDNIQRKSTEKIVSHKHHMEYIGTLLLHSHIGICMWSEYKIQREH